MHAILTVLASMFARRPAAPVFAFEADELLPLGMGARQALALQSESPGALLVPLAAGTYGVVVGGRVCGTVGAARAAIEGERTVRTGR